MATQSRRYALDADGKVFRVTTPDADTPADLAADPAEPAQLADYRPVTHQRTRLDGWTAVRQRDFLTVLAETGSVSEACINAGVSSRSAYRLRQRPDAKAFAEAWDTAIELATVRLTSIAFERATKGAVRELWKNGQLVAQTRAPSDKLLMFLIKHLLPRPEMAASSATMLAAIEAARARFPAALDALADHAVEMVPIESRDFFSEPPGDPREDW